MASFVPWTQPWKLGTAGEGDTVVLGVKSREVKAVAPAPSLCISGYQALVSRVVRICLWLCSDNQKIAIRSVSATLYQG